MLYSAYLPSPVARRAGLPAALVRVCLTILLTTLPALQCQAPDRKNPPPDSGAPSVSAPPRVCALDRLTQSFSCDMEFAPTVSAGCDARTPGLQVEDEFLQRMTRVSLETLYLDNDVGARPPFRYNSPGDIYARIQKSDCRAAGERCVCRFTYQDPELLEVFYHSAGCRRSSRLSDNPLYFRGNGCY
jgi:hypothetical protein